METKVSFSEKLTDLKNKLAALFSQIESNEVDIKSAEFKKNKKKLFDEWKILSNEIKNS